VKVKKEQSMTEPRLILITDAGDNEDLVVIDTAGLLDDELEAVYGGKVSDTIELRGHDVSPWPTDRALIWG
jgi:hypothetical protein